MNPKHIPLTPEQIQQNHQMLLIMLGAVVAIVAIIWIWRRIRQNQIDFLLDEVKYKPILEARNRAEELGIKISSTSVDISGTVWRKFSPSALGAFCGSLIHDYFPYVSKGNEELKNLLNKLVKEAFRSWTYGEKMNRKHKKFFEALQSRHYSKDFKDILADAIKACLEEKKTERQRDREEERLEKSRKLAGITRDEKQPWE